MFVEEKEASSNFPLEKKKEKEQGQWGSWSTHPRFSDPKQIRGPNTIVLPPSHIGSQV